MHIYSQLWANPSKGGDAKLPVYGKAGIPGDLREICISRAAGPQATDRRAVLSIMARRSGLRPPSRSALL